MPAPPRTRERALEENVFALLATKVTGESARSAWAALDAAAYALGAGSQLHARSLGDLWASSTWSRDRSEDRRVAWLEQAALRCSAAARAPPRRRRSARLFASALRRGVGVEKLFRVARSLLRDVDDASKNKHRRGRSSTFSHGRVGRRDATTGERIRWARWCAGPRCRCVHDTNGDADGSVRGPLGGAGPRIVWSRRYVSEEARAEGCAVSFRGDDGSNISGRSENEASLLKRAVLGLALWQHAWVDRSLGQTRGGYEARVRERPL